MQQPIPERVPERVPEPIAYIARTRTYYEALGYPAYQWAHFDDVPFAIPVRSVAQSRIVLITTAAPFNLSLGDQGPGAAYNAAAKFYRVYRVPLDPPPDLRISHVGYDRKHTSAADPNTWLPVAALTDAAHRGVIGSLAPSVIGIPTNRSQQTTLNQDAPEVFDSCIELHADLALFVPNCPVCHQSAALVARHLETHGIPTVVMGCARDIVENVGVARFLFSDFPLGNSAGKPFDVQSQRQTLALALALFDSATGPSTTLVSPQRFRGDDSWKADFMNIEKLPGDVIAKHRADFAEQKAIARRIREGGR